MPPGVAWNCERLDEARVPGFLRLVEECQRVGAALQDLDLEDPVPEVDDSERAGA